MKNEICELFDLSMARGINDFELVIRPVKKSFAAEEDKAQVIYTSKDKKIDVYYEMSIEDMSAERSHLLDECIEKIISLIDTMEIKDE